MMCSKPSKETWKNFTPSKLSQSPKSAVTVNWHFPTLLQVYAEQQKAVLLCICIKNCIFYWYLYLWNYISYLYVFFIYTYVDIHNRSSLLYLNYSSWGQEVCWKRKSIYCMVLTPFLSWCRGFPGNARILGVIVFISEGSLSSGETCPSVCWARQGMCCIISVWHMKHHSCVRKGWWLTNFLRFAGSGSTFPRYQGLHGKGRKKGKHHGDHAALVPQEEGDCSSCLWKCLVGDGEITDDPQANKKVC